jgi:hypothetical protein
MKEKLGFVKVYATRQTLDLQIRGLIRPQSDGKPSLVCSPRSNSPNDTLSTKTSLDACQRTPLHVRASSLSLKKCVWLTVKFR